MPTRTATIIFRVVSNEYIRKIDEITRKTHDLERATDRLSSGTARRAARAQETVNRKYQQQTREIQELIRNKRSLAQQTLTLIRNLGGLGRVTDIVASKFKYLAGGAVVGFLIYQMGVLGGRLRAVRDYFTDITVAQEGLYRGDAEDQNRQTVDRFRQASGGAVSNVTLESIGAQTARLGLNPKGMAVIIHKMVEQAILTGVGNIDQLVNSRFGSLRQGDLGILEELIIGTGDDPTRGRTALGLINSQTTRELQRNESVLAELTKTLGRVPTQLEVNGEKLRRITNEIAKAAEQGEVSLDNSFIGIERIRAEFTNAISEISLLFEPIINFLANTVADFFSGIKEHAEGLNRFIANTKSFIENSPLFQYSEEQKEVHKQRAEREERQIAALTASHPRVARALYPDRPEFNSTEQQPDPYAQERQAAAAISLAEQNKKLLDQTIAVEIATGKASIKMESFVSDINAVERAFSANILEKVRW